MNRKSLMRFIEDVSIYKKEIAIYSSVIIVRTLLSFADPLIFKKLIDYIQIEKGNFDMYYIVQLAGILIWVYIIKFFLSFFATKYNRYFYQRIPQQLNQKYLAMYALSDNNAVESFWTGKIVSIIQRGTDACYSFLSQCIQTGVTSVLEIIIVLGFSLYYFDYRITLLLIIWFIISGFINHYMNKEIKPLTEERRDKINDVDKVLTRFIMTKFEILQNKKIDKENSIINDYYNDITQITDKESKYRSILVYGQWFIINIIKVGVLFYISYQVYLWTVSFSEFVLFQILFSYVDGALWGMAWFVTRSGVYLTTYEKLIHTFDKFPKIVWYNTWNQYDKKYGDIQINNISFKYQNGSQLFSNFSLHLHGKKKTALVGSSWSGKSTIIKLISGYIRPDSGSIIIDNQNLSDISLESYYQHIGYLTQEPSVFDGTVRENLEYGLSVIARNGAERNDEAIWNNVDQIATSEQNWFLSSSQWRSDNKVEIPSSQTQMDEIIQLAQCQFIYDLPKWLDTQIGEKWIKLSGGQRQRLAIAKVMLKNPSIILLDEPTSALDSFAEEEVTKAMNNLFEWRTVIIVAHRLQTVKHADEIIVLGNNSNDLVDQSENSPVWLNTEQYTQILERGTHEELIAKGWYYAKMLELQSGF